MSEGVVGGGGRGRRPIWGGLVRHLIKLLHDINAFLDCTVDYSLTIKVYKRKM